MRPGRSAWGRRPGRAALTAGAGGQGCFCMSPVGFAASTGPAVGQSRCGVGRFLNGWWGVAGIGPVRSTRRPPSPRVDGSAFLANVGKGLRLESGAQSKSLLHSPLPLSSTFCAARCCADRYLSLGRQARDAGPMNDRASPPRCTHKPGSSLSSVVGGRPQPRDLCPENGFLEMLFQM